MGDCSRNPSDCHSSSRICFSSFFFWLAVFAIYCRWELANGLKSHFYHQSMYTTICRGKFRERTAAAGGRFRADGKESDKFVKPSGSNLTSKLERVCVAAALLNRMRSQNTIALCLMLFFGCHTTNGRYKNQCGKSYVHKSGGNDSCYAWSYC